MGVKVKFIDDKDNHPILKSHTILSNQEQNELCDSIEGWYESSTTSNTITENPLLPEGSLLEIPLTESEKNLIDEFYKELLDIAKKNEQDYSNFDLTINRTRNGLERIECLVDKYLQKEIKLNLLCNNHEYTVSDLVLKEIINVLARIIHITPTTIARIDRSTGEDALDESTDDENIEIECRIVHKLLLAGGKVHYSIFWKRELEYATNDADSIFSKCKKINDELKKVAYESIVNKNTQIQKDDLIVKMDNRSFYIKYPQGSSTIEVAKVVNNQGVKDLNLKYHIFHIEESIVKVESIGEKRNYTDVLQHGIIISFTTEAVKISIHLYPDKEDSNKIKVELDEESQDKINKLQDKSSLGKNCLLGGKNVLQAIKDGSFERNRSMSKGSTEQITLIQSNDAIKEPDVPSTSMKETSTSHILHGLGK